MRMVKKKRSNNIKMTDKRKEMRKEKTKNRGRTRNRK